ncbi:hypothetical protein MCAP1_001646 [Malassezia caprae]|uniref:Nucleoporin nup82 n=1 Tax=Malassezia caprae TaxID=1381934 RepID=A0AAF0IV83_9BASI|nr:hypothetical protein MCAP1_001646 [Malassezia caprae]
MRSWHEALPTHPVLERRGAPVPEADTARRTALLATRGTDMIVVVQNELRITPLAQTKRAMDQGVEAPGYKVLHSDVLDFVVQSVHVNPTGKLLVVVGTHTLALVILPRRGYMKQVGARVPVKAVRIGAFYHAPHGTSAIAQCRWHPLGAEGASLVVLTEDAIVREYDVAHDVEEPKQTIAVLPPTRSAPSKWSADDDDEHCAVSCAFGRDIGEGRALASAALSESLDTGAQGAPSWLPYALFVLMRSGDVYVVCPFLPHHATLTRAAIQALATHEAQHTRKYLAEILRQMPAHGVRASPAPDLTLDDDDAPPPEAVAITAPSSVAHRVAVQGPCLLRPSPRELDDEYTSQACDLWVGQIRADDAAARLDVLAIAARDGSLHLGLLAAPIAPAWARATAAPTIAVYECVDFALPAARASLLAANHVSLMEDPLYPDTIYATHRYGMHALSLRSWTAPLLEAMAHNDTQALQQTAQDGIPTDVTCIVRMPADQAASIAGALVLNDVYLSYTLVVLTADGQLAARELTLQASAGASGPVPAAEAERTYRPVLSHPFTAPSALAPAPLALPRSWAPRTAVLPVTPDALRALGQLAEAVRARLQEVAAAGNAVQARVSEQMAEMQRQLRELQVAQERATSLEARKVLERVRRLEETQAETMQRFDTLLQQLMDEHTPQLSMYERRWFDELERMAREFGAPESRAEAQRQKLAHQLEVLRPQLQARAAQRASEPGASALGTRQLARVESVLAEEAQLLAQARAKVQRLQQAMYARS